MALNMTCIAWDFGLIFETSLQGGELLASWEAHRAGRCPDSDTPHLVLGLFEVAVSWAMDEMI